MKSISLYVDKDTYLTRLHPFAKMFYILAAVSAPLIGGALWIYGLFLAVSLGLLISGKIIRKVFPLIAFSFTIIITIFLIHGLFNQENQKILFHIGPLAFYQEGLLYATRIGLNILNMLLAFATFVLTTKPADLVETMEQAGFSPRFGYMISSVFQIIPQMMGTMNTIMDAQRSRGMETEGSLLVRARAFIPLISPVVSSSLINTRERAIALEVRGFDSKNKKTFLREYRLAGKDKAFMSLMALLIAGSIVWRVLTWL
ncbi:energy-coupling factor transporter transmembrane component T family protein [Lacrimispora sphenoides]|uniref:Energy-coupling factor transport system permease protein n=1 Tax=Lacrimispora sphenoides JCM 1415 TaxID=1297793 RepID=A0ABY1C1C6_9FIRM|nr:energy-coupling factor transporter transmembrane component T [Lacrimispora sphenoides]SET52062.1 energy-coupling factor transport system permease protein [[Clostridium] sphenoides JCM 1415]SUY49574.1 cobalt transport protein [Lacrimispora sphenoides]